MARSVRDSYVSEVELTDLEDRIDIHMVPLDENGETIEDEMNYAWTVTIDGTGVIHVWRGQEYAELDVKELTR